MAEEETARKRREAEEAERGDHEHADGDRDDHEHADGDRDNHEHADGDRDEPSSETMQAPAKGGSRNPRAQTTSEPGRTPPHTHKSLPPRRWEGLKFLSVAWIKSPWSKPRPGASAPHIASEEG